jgi:hypothetical protein
MGVVAEEEEKEEEFNEFDIPQNRSHLRESDYWPADASNGLSYSKMKYVVDMRHPRKIVDGKRTPHPWCATTTGWHCFCKGCRKNDL